MKKLSATLIVIQLMYFFTCFSYSFLNTDTESSYGGASLFRKFCEHLADYDQGHIFQAVLMFVGVFSPIVICIIMLAIHTKKKFILSGILVILSILSIALLYTDEMQFDYVTKVTYNFYIMTALALLSLVLCAIPLLQKSKPVVGRDIP